MGQTLNLKLKGLYTLANHMSEVPEGALAEADNIVIDRDSIAESRRGFKEYGDALVGAPTAIRRIIPYQDALIGHYGSVLRRDEGAGVWNTYTGTFAEPDTGYRVRDAQSNKNLYITTAAGVKQLDAIDGTWKAAGVPRPLDGVGATTGASGFLATDASVAYRSVLVYTDANENEHPSAPSQRVVAVNVSGGDRNIALTFYLPSGLSTSYTLRVYRSPASADALTDPSDELQQVQEFPLTSTNLSNGYVSFTDDTPETLRGAFLYTSPSQGRGIAEQNDQPPFALDLCLYKGHMLYANIRSKHRLSETLLGAGEGGLTWIADNVATTNGSAIVTSVASTTFLHVGMKVKAAAGIPSTARILTIDSATQITMTVNATATGARDVEFQDIVTVDGMEFYAASATSIVNREFEAEVADTPATNIESTALSLVFVVNQYTSNSTVYAYYTSGFDDIPGLVDFEERTIGGAGFSVSSTAGDSFNPTLTTARASSNNAAENTIMSSKFQQPEAVPLENKFPAGSAPIRRILALRDAAYALSDKIYKLIGTDVSNFQIEQVDTTAKLVGPETAVVFNDAIFCFSDQGVIKIGGDSVQVVSRPIEDELQRVSSDLFTSFEDQAFGVAYETARRFYLHIPTDTTDARPTQAFLYNAFTGGWTRMPREQTCGLVNPADDKLYYGDYDRAILVQERKSYARTDYADREFAVTVVSSTGTTVTLSDTSNVLAGYLLVQSSRESFVTEVVNATTLTVADTLSWAAGAATAYEPIDWTVTWVPNTAGNPGIMKQFPECGAIFRDASFEDCQLGFSNDFFPEFEDVTIEAKDQGGAWGVFPWGESEWGRPVRGEQIVRTYVPRDYQRCHWLNVRLSGSEVFSNFKLAGLSMIYDEMSSRFR
jgi:hypothetical protein